MDTVSNSTCHTLKLILFLLATVAGQNTSPLNTAVNKETSSTSLNCSNTLANSAQFVWSFTNYTSGSTSNVATGCSVFNTQLYNVASSTNACNLLILNAQAAQAGLYTCSPGDQTASSAQFIVMESTATCDNTPLGENKYTFTCSVTFIGNMVPDVAWYSGSLTGGVIPSIISNTTYSVSASYNVSIYNTSEIPPNLCQVKFTAPSSPPTGQAINAPSYISTCNITNFILTQTTQKTTVMVSTQTTQHTTTVVSTQTIPQITVVVSAQTTQQTTAVVSASTNPQTTVVVSAQTTQQKTAVVSAPTNPQTKVVVSTQITPQTTILFSTQTTEQVTTAAVSTNTTYFLIFILLIISVASVP